MNRVIVRYKVKGDSVQENIDYIQAVFSALEKSKPDGLRYASFQLEDGVSFVHIASIETDDGTNPLPALDEFKTFVKDIAARCDEAERRSSDTRTRSRPTLRATRTHSARAAAAYPPGPARRLRPGRPGYRGMGQVGRLRSGSLRRL